MAKADWIIFNPDHEQIGTAGGYFAARAFVDRRDKREGYGHYAVSPVSGKCYGPGAKGDTGNKAEA